MNPIFLSLCRSGLSVRKGVCPKIVDWPSIDVDQHRSMSIYIDRRPSTVFFPQTKLISLKIVRYCSSILVFPYTVVRADRVVSKPVHQSTMFLQRYTHSINNILSFAFIPKHVLKYYYQVNKYEKMNAGASTDFMGKNSTLNRMFGAKQDNLTNYLLSASPWTEIFFMGNNLYIL